MGPAGSEDPRRRKKRPHSNPELEYQAGEPARCLLYSSALPPLPPLRKPRLEMVLDQGGTIAFRTSMLTLRLQVVGSSGPCAELRACLQRARLKILAFPSSPLGRLYSMHRRPTSLDARLQLPNPHRIRTTTLPQCMHRIASFPDHPPKGCRVFIGPRR